MAFQTEVFQGDFNLKHDDVDALTQALERLSAAADKVTGALKGVTVKIPPIDTKPLDNIASAAEVAAEKVTKSLGKALSLQDVKKQTGLDDITAIITSQFQQIPDKTQPIVNKLKDEFVDLKRQIGDAFDGKNIDAAKVDELKGKFAGLANEVRKITELQTSESGDAVAGLASQFDKVREAGGNAAVSLSERFGGLKLAVSGTGSTLEGLREIIAGTSSSTNVLVNSLDFFINRGNPLKQLSNDLQKNIAGIADAASLSSRALEREGDLLARTIVKELGDGSRAADEFNKQATKVTAAFDQIFVTASKGGDISTALLRAQQSVKGLEDEYKILIADGIIQSGTTSDAMFKKMIVDAQNAAVKVQAMTARYNGTKQKMAEVKAEQDKLGASGQKANSIFGQISIKLGNMFNIFRSGSPAVTQTTTNIQKVESELQKTASIADVVKGSFIGAFGGTILAGFASKLSGIVGQLGSQFYDVNNTIQNTRITIQGMLEGSGVDAKAAIQGFTDYVTEQAAKTPFEFGDAVEQALRLVQQGFDPQRWFTPAANAAAAMNKPMEQFINGMVKLQAGAKGAAVDMFRDFGLNVNQISGYFDQATGKALSFEEVQRRTADGTIKDTQKLSFEFDKQGSLVNSTGDALNIMNAYLNQNATFAKAAEARSLSLDGVISNLKDSVTKVFIAFGQPLFDKLTTGATGLLSKINQLSPMLETVAANLGTGLASAIDTVTTLFNGSFLSSLQNSEGTLASLSNFVISLSQGDWQTAWQSILEVASSALDGILSYLNNFGSNAYDWGASFIDQIAQGIYDAAGGVLDAVAEIGNAIASYLMPGSPPSEGPLSTIDKWGKGVMDVWTEGTGNIDTSPLKDALGKVKDVFTSFDLGSAQQDVLSIQEQINQAESQGFVPAELKKQLQLAQDKVTLLQQQEQLQAQLAQQDEKTAKDQKKGKQAGGGGGAGAGGGSPQARTATERKTAEQIRSDALAVLDKQLKDGVIKYEDYAKDRLKIEQKFYEDTAKEGGQVTDQNIKDIKFYQSEIDRLAGESKKKKQGDKAPEVFTPPSVSEIFKNFADKATGVGKTVGNNFVAAIKVSTAKSMDAVKANITERFSGIIKSVTDKVGELFGKFKENLSPKTILIFSAIAGFLVTISSGPIIAGVGALIATIGTLASSIGILVASIAGFTAVGLVVTAIILNWDTISSTAASGIQYLSDTYRKFIDNLGGTDAALKKFNAIKDSVKVLAGKIGDALSSAFSIAIGELDFAKAFEQVKANFGQLDFSGLTAQLGSLVAPLANAISTTFSGIFTNIKAYLPTSLVTQVQQLAASFSAFFSQGRLGGELLNLLRQLGELFVSLLPVLKAVGLILGIVAGLIINVLVSALQALGSSLPFIETAFAGVVRVVSGVVDLITAGVLALQGVWALLRGDSQTASTLFQQALGNMASAATNIMGGILQVITSTGLGILAFITSFVTSFVANVLAFIPGFQNASLAIYGFRDSVMTSLSTLSTNVIAIIVGLSNQLQIILPALWTGLASGVKDMVASIVGFFTDLYMQLVGGSIVPDMVTELLVLFDTLVVQGVAAIAKLGTDAVAKFKDMAGKFQEMGTAIITGLLNGINASKDKVIEVLKNLAADAISSAASALGIQSPSTRFAELGVQVMQGFNQGIASIQPNVKSIVNAAADDVEKFLDQSFGEDKTGAALLAFKRAFRANFDQIVALGSKAGGELLLELSGAPGAAGVEGGDQLKTLQQAATTFVAFATDQAKTQWGDFAKQQAETLKNINKVTEDTMGKFNQQVFNIRGSATEARIELERLFNRTVTDTEVEKMAKVFEGRPVDQLNEQERLIYRNYLLQQKLTDATAEESSVRQAMAGFGQLTTTAQDLIEKIIPPQTTDKVKNTGDQLLQALGLGMDAGTGDVLSKLATISAKIIGQLKTQFGIASPSTVMTGFGQNLTQGLANGITDGIGKVSGAMDLVSQAINPAATLRVGAIGNGFNFDNLPSGSGGSLQLIQYNTIGDQFDMQVFTNNTQKAIVELLRTGR